MRRNQPLIVNDAKHHPLVYDNLAIDDLNVAAYLGVPLLKDNVVLGAFCVISDSPRNWTDADLAALTKLASSCSKELIQRKATMDSQMELENRLRQSQKMEAIGQLSAGVAHDFNNILWAIQIRSELLRHELIARGNSLEHVEQIDSAVDAAKGVVEQLLICGRPEDQPPTQVSLVAVVEQAIPLLKTSLSPSVELVLETTNDRGIIVGEASQLHQVVLNLCSNADHAMRSTGGQIVISIKKVACTLEPGARVGNYVELKVSDQGYGIPPEMISRVHDPYFTTKPAEEGTGLGLWTVFGITRNHNAHISVSSVPEQGTTMTILFPACDAAQESIPNAESNRQDVPRSTNANVLIIDDDQVIASGLDELLTLEGHQVIHFTNRRDALGNMQGNPAGVDVMISDRSARTTPGDTLLRKCKELHPSLRIVVCSGYVDDFSDSVDAPYSVDAYCVKPYKKEELCGIIARLVASQREATVDYS